MSSPYVPFQGDFGPPLLAGSPTESPPDAAMEEHEPTLRPMRLKVLYSSDAENKTNCLAKWPEILNIRTAYLDENTQIGVIELKTCIQAIVTASPELDCKYGQDYTIYAYDYSEYETPLVGQGMLSRALASISSTPTAPAHESDTIVTGRVCRTPMGLFGNGIHEVLEVKLRLVPVPTKLQPQYIESMKQQRDLNQGIPEGCDPRAWQEFLRQNPGMMTVLSQNRSQSPVVNASQQRGIEHVQRLVSEGYRPQSAHRTASYTGSVASGGSNRSGSPTPSLQSMATTQPIGGGVRPASRASDHAGTVRSRRESISGSIEWTYEESGLEDGPQRKRAKVMKADHPGKTSIGKAGDSLRVTASAAASIRVLQPSAIRPGLQTLHSLEGPPRVPTPTPGKGLPRRNGAKKPVRSSLANEPIMTSDSGYKSFASDDANPFAESAICSPENGVAQSDYNSPEDVASSPPIFGNPAASVAPSSPILPAMPKRKKAGSAGLEDPFTDSKPCEQPWIDESSKIAAAYSNRSGPRRASSAAITSEAPRPALSQAELDEEARQREVSMRNARRAIGLKRSQTWSCDQPSSDPVVPERPQLAPPPVPTAPSAKPELERPRSRNTNWNKEKRKAAMQSKLQESIEAGQMPQFCENCGAIETPTWRRAYSRIFSGDPEALKSSDDDGAILFVQVLETNEDGSTKLFKIFRKVVPSGEEGYSDVLLCNPCGIWLSNHKCMRPETHWGKKKPRGGDRSKDKRSRAKKQPGEAKADQSDRGNITSEAANPASEMSIDVDGTQTGQHTDIDMGLPSVPLSMNGDDPFSSEFVSFASSLNADEVAALERAIRASPGTARKSPKHLEKESRDPARRTLFPSPKSDGPLGVNIEDIAKVAKNAPKTFNERRGGTDTSQSDEGSSPSNPVDADSTTPEALPVTPSRKSDSLALRKHVLEMKTPLLKNSPANTVLTTGDFFSSAAKAYLHAPQTPSRTPTKNSEERMTPFARHLNQLLADTQGDRSDFDELNLPPLMDRMTPGRALPSSAFDFGDYSSDLPNFPSSPGWFDMQDAVYDEAGLGNEWRMIWGSAEKAKSEPRLIMAQDEADEGAGTVAAVGDSQ